MSTGNSAHVVKAQIHILIEQAVTNLCDSGIFPSDMCMPDFSVERPRDRAHGDFSSNIAMLLIKTPGISRCQETAHPRAIAQALIMALPDNVMFSKVEVAGPGFLNLHLTMDAWQQQLYLLHEQGSNYGCNSSGDGRCVGVEFVSANPTGPLHVGHGRAAVIGDCISRVLVANGWKVVNEYYYNDTGAQIENLALSVQARALGKTPESSDWPKDGYHGAYISEIARAYCSGETVPCENSETTGDQDPYKIDVIRRFAVAYLRHQQNIDLALYGVRFDVYFLESSLYETHAVEKTVDKLIANNHTYEEGGALWLRSTSFGDDKDRVMRKSDGSYTYFVPDVAYHHSKWQRGYVRAITELGADHHGSLTRVRAGLQALSVGIPQGYPEYVLHQMVTVMRDGEEVKLSKRAGGYLTLRALIDEVGCDATRWFLVARKPDSQLTFDIDLARSKSLANPVYYVQLSYARICGLFRQLDERGLTFNLDNGLSQIATLSIDHSALRRLLIELFRYPDVVYAAGAHLEPHLITIYLHELAQVFQSYYNENRFLVDDADTRDIQLALAATTRQVLANGLKLMGISAPETM